ncbi:MAG: bifunctional homocysteine S-methyltransferase/methylenetetrahydrofolate reductase [Nitrospinota bacterium]|jgi:homocysteine S-methyltransferase|nr:bifunctional homocysteine S-methyltransferase/methylenetetrahydrofolate reductase [Nitrospinota bacterium]HJN03158.1 bifunctional homocysteine S-methyltransferase/methylenetetrahydrofolate reductase [Nitrospinota bacterium]
MESFKEALKNKFLVCDGAMGTALYSKGIFINRCFDELNLTNPDLIREIHSEYIKSGADIIETNSFGANRFKLQRYGLDSKVYDINKASAVIAKDEARGGVFVAGAIGPIGGGIEPLGKLSKLKAKEAFIEQAKGLLDGGVDLFILETFSDLNELHQAYFAIRELCTKNAVEKPIITQITFEDDGNTFYGVSPVRAVKEMESWGTDAAGANCSIGPQPMFESIRKMAASCSIPLSVMPNAGLPRIVEGRQIYLSTPEYFATYAKRFIRSGVRIVGGCCGTTAEHIKLICSAVKAISPSRIEITETAKSDKTPKTITPLLTAQKSDLAKKLSDNKFVVSVELLPPKGCDPSKVLEAAKKLKEAGVDNSNIPDGPRASARMSSMSLAGLFLREVGIEPIVHYTCRDRNLLGMQSDILGAEAAGIKNILAVTGDPPKLGNYPDATAVYDVDAIGLVKLINNLNHGLDVAKNPIGKPAGIHIGVGVNPGAINIEEEERRFRQKVEAGAEFVLTQPVFEEKLFFNFLERNKDLNIPIILGVLPLTSYRSAEFLHNEVPGMSIPENIRKRMKKADAANKAKETGIEIAREAFLKMKDKANGAYIMAPVGGVDTALKALKGLI